MAAITDSERKSANCRAFALYLRTGRRLPVEWLGEERKFNPYHDPEDGRFTFGPGGNASNGSSGSMAPRRANGGKPYPVRIDLESARSHGARVAQKHPAPPPIRFEHRSGLDLSAPVIAKANSLSDSIELRTGYRIVVTSGRRNEIRQAEAMYNNYQQGKPPKYANRSAENEVQQAYDNGMKTGKERQEIISDMANVLKNQTRRGIFLSRHMRSRAIDIRTPPASVVRAIRNHPSVQSAGVEDDHIHIQFH